MAFPTLKYKSVEIDSEDNAIKSSMQSGLVLTRKKFTKTRKTFTVSLPKLTNAEYELLKAHYNEVETYGSFTWTNPIVPVDQNESQIHTVRFVAPLSASKDGKFSDYYDVKSFKLVEV